MRIQELKELLFKRQTQISQDLAEAMDRNLETEARLRELEDGYYNINTACDLLERLDNLMMPTIAGLPGPIFIELTDQ